MDTIHIEDLMLSTCIGITDEERSKPQTVKISVWLRTDISKAAKTDDINDTIDYAEVAKQIQILGKQERKTIERFAEDISQMILQKFDTNDVSVSVRKYCLEETDSVAITIHRSLTS
ncbi:MAG: dihydroneopterin aldolase [Candidatus Peregrinibacteria bacterium]|nr:dihydroneopterin aldolase [Candidatus Peregrinibacteria bacterium]MCB9808128.1 dihydroneopterin aldolase [Candidatus Peribacteria bacterium]